MQRFIPVVSLPSALRKLVLIAVLAGGAFAAATYELTLHTGIRLEDAAGENAEATSNGLMNFYLWHLGNSLPGSPLETVRLEPPYEYASEWIGTLVLAYCLIVVTPVLKYVHDLIRWRREHGLSSAHERAAR